MIEWKKTKTSENRMQISYFLFLYLWGCFKQQSIIWDDIIQCVNNQETTYQSTHLLVLPNREVSNRSTGWTFTQLLNYFAHPINQRCPLPKIAYPVNDLTHRKTGHYGYQKYSSLPQFFEGGLQQPVNSFRPGGQNRAAKG